MKKIWTKNYVLNVPHTIDSDQYSSIPDMLEECFEKYRDNPCFMNFGETLTFRQVDELSQAYAGFLQNECRLEKGDRVAIMMPNCLQYPVALFGALRAGMVNVNVSPLYRTEAEIHYALQHTGAKCILTLANFAHLVQKAIPGTHVKHVVVTEIGDLFSFPKRLLFNFVVKTVKKMVPAWCIPNAISFKKTLASNYRKKFIKPSLCGDDVAYLQFSEGRDTGVPKCAVLTHRNFIANGLQNTVWFHGFYQSNGCVLATLPFSKLISMTTHCLTFMRLGITNNLITNPRDVNTLVSEIKKHRPIAIISVRSILNDLLFNEDFQKIDFSCLKTTFTGGMAIPQALAERWQSITQSTITEAYVLTEAAPIVTINPVPLTNFTGSLGLPLPSTEVKICNEEGQELPVGSRGEIWIKGPQVIKSYWNQPEENKLAFTEDGWLKTSDMGYMNTDGYFYFIDRKEELIKTEMGPVYPSEVENIIREIPGIKETVVIQGKSKDNHPIIKAYIVKTEFSSSEEISEESIIAYCKRFLEDYQVPHKVQFIDEFPYSATGYILRRLLREENK